MVIGIWPTALAGFVAANVTIANSKKRRKREEKTSKKKAKQEEPKSLLEWLFG